MKKVRFAPSPTGSLHIGNALSAYANRRLGDWMLLRIDDTDPVRNVPGGEEASVDDDGDFGITHVVRGNDHRPNEELHRRLHAALGTRAPEYVHHGLILGADGKKLSKRAEGATVESLRDAGIPAEAVGRYLEQLDLPKHDVHYDLARIRRYAVEALAALSDEELAARAGVPVSAAPLVRGAHDLAEARAVAESVLAAPAPAKVDAVETLTRFRELRERANGGVDYETARSLLRELKAAGGDLRALRLALTGRERGPELAAVVAALDRGLACRVEGPDGWSVATDMPAGVGGGGAAPTPGWLLRAAWAACEATVIAMRAAELGIPLDRIEVVAESESDLRGLLGADESVPAGPLGARSRIRVAAAGVEPERLRELVDWADRHSAVADALRRELATTIELELEATKTLA